MSPSDDATVSSAARRAGVLSLSAAPAPAGRRVTLRDIAARAGVHVTAVSMALRNHPRISAATRERVRALASEMGYRQDALLSALCRYRSRPRHHSALAWLNSFPKDIYTRVHLYGEYLRGAKKRAEELGLGLLEIDCSPDSGMTAGRVRTILRTRNIRGVLVPPQPNSHDLLKNWDELSSVTFGYSFDRTRLHAVVPNQYSSMQTIMREVRALGYRRVGAYIDQGVDQRCNRHWQAAYWVDYHSQPEPVRVPPLFHPPNQRNLAELRAWVKREKVEVVVVIGNVDSPLELPARIGCVFHSVNSTQPWKAGIDENGLLTGATAVDMVVGMFARQEAGVPAHPQRVLVDGFWQPGNLKPKKKGRPTPSPST